MSLALIQESAKEVRRLAIAGSSLAVGDFRLKKLIGPLEQAGAKAPVFTQVAKAIAQVVEGREGEAAGNLLALSTLLNAILYTQGQSAAEGAWSELESHPGSCAPTRTTARVLKPLVQALTGTGGGRLEVIKSAVEHGTFKDLRLIDPSIHALGDAYPELADFVAQKILPAYGPGIVPRLRAGFDPKGKRQDARRLQVMHQLDPAATLPLCKNALEEGSPEVKAAAIACLGEHEDCLPLVLEQARAKNKTLRAAALQALARHDRPEIEKVFVEVIEGKTLDILAGPFRVLRNRAVLHSLIAEGRRVFGLLMKGDSEQMPRLWEILDCVEERQEPEVEEFVLSCFEQGEKLARLKPAKNSYVGGDDVVYRLAAALYKVGTPKTLGVLLAKRDVLPTSVFGFVLRSVLRTWTPAQVFEEFSPLLGQKKGQARERGALIEQFIAASAWDESSAFSPDVSYDEFGTTEAGALRAVAWDARWLDAAIKADNATLVCHLARPNHPAALDYLLARVGGKKASDAGLIVRGLVRCRYPKVTETFLSLVAKKIKTTKYMDYELQFLFENARHLPPAGLPQLEEFARTLDEKFCDRFLEAIEPLRTANPKPQ